MHADDFLDLGKWQRAQISHLALVDCAAQLQLARDKWIERERPFACTFVDAGTTLVTNASNQRSKFCFVLFSTFFSNNTTHNAALTLNSWADNVLSYVDAAACVPFDAIFTTQALEYAASDEATLGAWFDGAARLLRPGGALFGAMCDSSQLWSRAQKTLMNEPAATGVVTGDLFELTFDRGLDELVPFGTRFALTLQDSVGSTTSKTMNIVFVDDF